MSIVCRWLFLLLVLLPHVALAQSVAARVDIRTVGGYADALRGAAHYAAAGRLVSLGVLQRLNVRLTSAGGEAATISPAWVAPLLGALPPQSLVLDAAGAGPGGAAVHGILTASDPATGAIACTGCRFAPQADAAVRMQISLNDQNGTSTLAGAVYGPVGVADLPDGGSRLTLDPPVSVPAGLTVCLQRDGQPEWCGVVRNAPSDGSLVVRGNGASPAVIPGTAGVVQARLAWGPFLFRPDDATACAGGRSLEVPNAGAGRNPVTFLPNPAEVRIAARLDPFTVRLTEAVATAVPAGEPGGVDGYLIAGCDDWPAYHRAVEALYRDPAAAEQPKEIDFPADSFMASGTGDIKDIEIVLQCGEGTVFWPSAGQVFWHGAASCSHVRPVMSFPDVKDVIPALHLRHLASLPPGSVATLVTAGNSPFGPGSNGAGSLSSRHAKLCQAFRQAWPELRWRCIDRSFGGTQMWSLDRHGFTNGRPSGSAPPNWYPDFSRAWLDYIEDDKPDVLVLGFADQEIESISFAALLSIIGDTQSADWAKTTGRNPDIGLLPWPWQPSGFHSQVGTDFAASLMRSFAKACVTPLASGGCPFLIDEARMLSILVDGWDPEAMPMRHAQALPTAGGRAIAAFPWHYETPRPGLVAPLFFYWPSTQPSVGGMLRAAGGELDFTIGANDDATPQSVTYQVLLAASAAAGETRLTVGSEAYKLNIGDGVGGAPALAAGTRIRSVDATGGTVTVTRPLGGGLDRGARLTVQPPGPPIGYPGGILRVSQDTASGHIAFRYDMVYFVVARADCTGVRDTARLVCATPEIGNWHRGLQIAIPGAGHDPCPDPGGAPDCFVGSIDRVAFTPEGEETVTLAGGVLAADVTGIRPIVFRTAIPRTVSERPAESAGGVYSACRIDPGAGVHFFLQVEYRGSTAALTVCDAVYPGPSLILDRFVERFDGPFRFTVDSPNHLAHGAIRLIPQGMPVFASATRRPSFGQWWEVAPEYPTAAARARLAPDIYGWCTGMPVGDPAGPPWGGECGGHYGQMGTTLIDDAILAALRLR